MLDCDNIDAVGKRFLQTPFEYEVHAPLQTLQVYALVSGSAQCLLHVGGHLFGFVCHIVKVGKEEIMIRLYSVMGTGIACICMYEYYSTIHLG
jgi:hypothetical protein